ncbi:MAG: VWA domain-containing protein [Desulfobacteraceae bacterium]|nr:MAG: VWA domain-containing protein [Desulfobacteraceae bacterium]
MGAYKFLELPAEVIPIDLISMETAVFKEEPPSPQPKATISEEILTRKAVVAKSPISMQIETDRNIDNLIGPIPTAGDLEPRLNVDNIPTRGAVAVAREGQIAASKPMVTTFNVPPLRLSAVNPSPPDEPLPVKIDTPKVLVEAEAMLTPTYSQTLQKIGAPRERTRAGADFTFELSPIPTIESPSIPVHREMILAMSRDHPLERLTKTETKRNLQSVVRPDVRMALNKETAEDPKPMAPINVPAALNLNILSSFPLPGSAKGAAYLFVVDTSGSVKGTPLEGIKKSAREFVRLMGPNDRAGIMTFDDKAELVSPLTSEKTSLRRKINELRTAGTQTVLFDALIKANTFLTEEDRENRFMVLFSDGKDEGSQSTLDEVIRETRRSEVSILSVGYTRVEREYLAILKKLAGNTGGDFVYAPQFQDILTLYRASRGADAEASEIEKAIGALLNVKSKPLGAQVFIDGVSKGETPLNLELPLGTHEILLTLPHYHDWQAQIELSEKGEIPILVRLLPTMAKNE